jgi:hypothetical protein
MNCEVKHGDGVNCRSIRATCDFLDVVTWFTSCELEFWLCSEPYVVCVDGCVISKKKRQKPDMFSEQTRMVFGVLSSFEQNSQ